MKHAAASRARRLLDEEVPIEQNGLRASEQRALAVQVVPARLHHADACVAEVAHEPHQEVGGWHKVGIEDAEQLASGRLHRVRERASFIAHAIRPSDDTYGLASRRELSHDPVYALPCIVRGVVDDLHLEAVARIGERRCGADDALGDVALVVHRELHRDEGQLSVLTARVVDSCDPLRPATREQPRQPQAVSAKANQQQQRRVVGCECGRLERVHAMGSGRVPASPVPERPRTGN